RSLSDVDLAVFAAEEVAFERLFALETAAEAAGCRTLTVIARRQGVDLGPLIIPGLPGYAVTSARFPFVDTSTEGAEEKIQMCGWFALPSSDHLPSNVIRSSAECVHRTICDPCHTMA